MARTSSESETTALSQQPDQPAPVEPKPETAPADVYKIADLSQEPGKTYVLMPDGRHVLANVADGVKLHRHGKVTVTGDENDLTVTGTA